MYTQLRTTFHLCPKKTKWRTEFSEGFACPIPLQWVDFAESGRVILGCLANRFGSRFEKNKKLVLGCMISKSKCCAAKLVKSANYATSACFRK